MSGKTNVPGASGLTRGDVLMLVAFAVGGIVAGFFVLFLVALWLAQRFGGDPARDNWRH